MKIAPNLNFTQVRPETKSLADFVQMIKNIYQNFSQAFNGQITFGDGTNLDNINGSWINFVTPGAPNTDITLTHNMGRLPAGYLVMQKSAATDIYTGSIAATNTQITLRATMGGVLIRLFVLMALLCLFMPRSEAQGYRHDNVAWKATTPTGSSGLSGTILQPIPSAIITVCNGTVAPPIGSICSPTTNIFSNAALTTSLNNPTNADINGNFFFYVTTGQSYIISISGVGVISYSYILTAPLVASAGSTFSNVTSATANPALTGFIRAASTDQICFRNNANTLDICINKNGADALFFGASQFAYLNATQTWPNQQTFSLGLVAPSIGPSVGQQHTIPAVASDTIALLNASQTLNNKAVVSPVFSGTASGTGAFLPVSLFNSGTGANSSSFWRGDGVWAPLTSESTWAIPGLLYTTLNTFGQTLFAGAHTLVRINAYSSVGASGCGVFPVLSFRDFTGSTNLASITWNTATSFFDSGPLSVAIPAGDTVGFAVTTAGSSCGTIPSGGIVTMIYK